MADDLLQDAWLALLRRGGPYHQGYLFRTLRNRCVDLERRRGRVPFDSLDEASASLPLHENLVAFPASVALRKERRTLEEALGQLRPEEREALFLATVEGYTVQEISRFIAKPLGTVSSLLRRGREKLKSTLLSGEEPVSAEATGSQEGLKSEEGAQP